MNTALIVPTALALSACVAAPLPSPTGGRLMQKLVVSGSLTYRQRVSLEPGSVAQVIIIDVSIADKAELMVASQTLPLGTRQVLIPFQCQVDRGLLQPNHRYALRGSVSGSDGDVTWTTTTARFVDVSQTRAGMGELNMVQVR